MEKITPKPALPEKELFLKGNPKPKPDGFWARIDWHINDWAAKRLTASEYQSGLDMELWLKKNFLKHGLIFLIYCICLSVALTYAIPKLQFPAAVIIVFCICLSIGFGMAGVLSGSQRILNKTGNSSKGLIYGVFFGMFGALVGATIGSRSNPLEVLQKAINNPQTVGILVLALLVALAISMAMKGLMKIQMQSISRQKELERLSRQNAEADLKLLQAQVEPHFLYNTLANLRYLVQSGSPQALKMTDHLIEYLRQSLPSFRNDITTVEKDAELAKSYLSIMEIRMAGQLEFAVNIDEQVKGFPLPPLMLLTLLENAVKHGVARTPDGGRIDVEAYEEDDYLVVQVRDTGAGLDATPSTTLAKPSQGGVGLSNIRERLTSIYGERATLELTANRPRGAVATLSLPITRRAEPLASHSLSTQLNNPSK
jgi:hypothetical protein